VIGVCNRVGGGVLFDMLPSINCPVPFSSRLITTHTSTATAVVNNTLHDATRSSCGGSCDRSPRRSPHSTAHVDWSH